MSTYELETFCAMASNELLRHIVASEHRKWRSYKFYAKRALNERDHKATFG